MSSSRAAPRPDLTPEQEARDVRARAWAYALSCLAENRREGSQCKEKAPGVTSTKGEDGTEIKGDSADESTIPQEVG